METKNKPDFSADAFNFNDIQGKEVPLEETKTKEQEEVELPKKEEEEEQEEEETVVTPKPEPSKEDEESEEQEEQEFSVKDILFKASGYEIEDELSDDVEGIIKGTQILAEKLADERIEEFFSSNETIKEFTDYILKGGDPRKYIEAVSPKTDYSEIDTSNEDNQKKIVRDYLKDQGADKDEIEQYIKSYEDSNILEKQAILAKKFLVKEQEKAKTKVIKEQERLQEQKKIEAEQAWKQVESTLEKDTLAGIPVNKKDRDKFKEFMGGTTKEGNSLRAEKYNSMTLEQKLLIDYLIYKGPDKIKELVDNMATTKNTKSITDILKKTNKQNSSQGTIKTTTKRPDLSANAFKID